MKCQQIKKNKTENKLNPRNFDGAEANVFKQTFEYPPSKEDKLKNNKINKEESLFPNQIMIPPGKGIEKCSYGNLFDIVTLESQNPVIHHSKPTHDSRTGLLSVHFLKPPIVIANSGTMVNMIGWSEPHQHRQNQEAASILFQWIC